MPPNNVQDFLSDSCDQYIPQGSVTSERQFVRTTLIESSLDQQLLNWQKDNGSILSANTATVVLGIPMQQVSSEYAQIQIPPMKIAIDDDNEVEIGLDLIALPGSKTNITGNVVKNIFADQIDDTDAPHADLVSSLSENQKRELANGGEITVSTASKNEENNGTITTLRLISRDIRNTVPPVDQPDTMSPTAFAFSSGSNFISAPELVHFYFSRNYSSAIKAFLADTRSGTYYRSYYQAHVVVINLADANFDEIFDNLKTRPEWTDFFKIAKAPPLPQFQIGLVQVFRQTERLAGFSKGRLIDSVTLGPEESVTVEVFSFDRTLEEREESRSNERSSERDITRNQSQSVELLTDIENSVGASVGTTLGGSLPVDVVKANFSVNTQVSTEINSRNQSTINLLTEASFRATEKYKENHQVKTLTRREFGNESRSTRVFKNPNLGRTLNLHHFEVVGHYETSTTVDSNTQFCLLVETPQIGPFDRDWIRAHHDFLDDVLKHDIYRKGLAAANLLAAQQWIDELAVAEKRNQEEERQLLATAEEEVAPENYLPNKGIFSNARRLKEKLELYAGLESIENAINLLAEHLNPLSEGISESSLREAEDTVSKWAWWSQFDAAYPGIPEAAKIYTYEYNRIINLSNQPNSADDMISNVADFVERFDDDWLMTLKVFGAGVIVLYLKHIPAMLNPAVYLYVLKLLYLPNDKGIPKLISSLRADYAQHKAKQTAETLAPPSPPIETLKPDSVPRKPPRTYSEKEISIAHADMGRLTLHLKVNSSHYNNEFYKREDPAIRIERLNQLGVSKYVGNRLLGFAGTKSIYPLNLQSMEAETIDYLNTLVPDNSNIDVNIDPIKSSRPTGGIVSEMVLGQCEALEPYIVEHRKHDLRRLELDNLERERVLDLSISEQPRVEPTIEDESDN